MVARDITVFRTDGECRCNGDVGQAEFRQRSSNDIAASFRAGNSFVHIQVQNCTAGVLLLKIFLHFKGFEKDHP